MLSSGTKIQTSALLYLLMQGRHKIHEHKKKSRSVLQTELVPRTVSEHSNSIKIISRCGFWDVNQNMNRGEDKTVYSKNLEQYLNMDQRGM